MAARELRDQCTNEYDIAVLKYYEGFEKDFVNDIRNIIKSFFDRKEITSGVNN